MTSTPHDALFKATFSQPEHAAGALRAVLPAALAARIDFATLATVPGSFIDEALAGRHTDLLFSARLAGRRAFLYLLFEHQSDPPALMPYRLLTYMVRIWEDYVRNHPRATLLPAILPVVLHHGEGGWRAAVSFEELIDLDRETLRLVAKYLPRFRFLLDDLDQHGDEALHDRAMSALGRVVLLCFKYARNPNELVRRLDRWVDVVREVWRAPSGASALGLVVRYIFEIGGERPVQALRALAARKVGKDVEKTIVSYADQLRSEGRREGLREGSRKGLQRGRCEILLRQMRLRFGELPEPIVARVKAAKTSQLDLWAERVLSAPTLHDVFNPARTSP
jgi:predicted transposase/invertase (TIGR01784 family)